MPAANESGKPPDHDAPFVVDRPALDAARARCGRPPGNAAWSACTIPGQLLVVDGEGRLRGCPTAGNALLADAVPLTAAWRSDALADLRAQLARGELPARHCRGCTSWLADELWEQAPLLRDQPQPGSAPRDATTAPAGTWPDTLVLELEPDAPLASAVAASLPELLPHLRRLVVRTPDLQHAALPALLATLRAATPRPELVLRVTAIGDARAGGRLLAGITVSAIELLAHDRHAGFQAAASLAKATGASFAVTFLLTPASWFDFEDVARSAAAVRATMAWRVLADDGQVPLQALALPSLRFVKDAVTSAWQRLANERAPAGLPERAFDNLAAELRAVLRRRTDHALADATTAAGDSAGLPPVEHPWYGDDERRPWWLEHLFAHWHLPGVPEWLDQQLRGSDAADLVRQQAWLRALVQRAASERRPGDSVELLRTLYSDGKLRSAVQAADAAFAAAFPLARWGGPWTAALGLQSGPTRTRPFPVGKAKKAKARSAADVTVLVPSFRHADFVAETLQSVLAQRYAGFRVLVVDDCSPDDTVARARAVDDERIEVRVNAQNLGLGNSVLQALAAVDTPFVALLNSDDLFHPDRLAKCRDVLLARPEVQLVTTGVDLVDRDGGELTPANASLVLDGQQVFDWVHWYAGAVPVEDLGHDALFGALLEHNFLATSSNLVCRTDWLRAQAESLKSLKYCLDWQLFLQAALDDSLHHIHEPLVAYRLHASNTVWFRDGARWAYYLEVNRVAAAAVRAFAQRGAPKNGAATARVLSAIASHLANNRETDGFALFVNAVFDAVELDRLAATSPPVRELVQRLAAGAEALRSAHDRAVRPAAPDDSALRLLRGELAVEQAEVESGTRRWLQGYCAELEGRLRDCWSGRDRSEQEKAELVRRQAELDQMVAGLEAQARRHGELERDVLGLRSDLESARGTAAALQDLRQQLAHEIAAAHVERDGIRQDRDLMRAERDRARIERNEMLAATQRLEHQQRLLERELAEHRAALQTEQGTSAQLRELRRGVEAELAAAHQGWTATRTYRQEAERRRDELAVALDRESAQVGQLRAAKQGLEARCNELVHELARSREEMARLVRSREFRSGNFLWNKMPLAYLSRRGKKWYRRLVDAKNRAVMMLRRPRRAEGTAVVAACWQWPIYSHTFVYQEMIALTHMGLAVKMFHWDLGDTNQLHKAFGYLADHRTQLQPIWENHARDKQHFETTRPGKLRAFLERVAKATGKSVAELDKEPLVVQGCTFARMAELAGASYLHSYFFYDQSFMAMQAAFLLDLPRGVSCYADHMLDDYPFKLVPLHVELASVVVATSARIKRELSAKTGGRFDDKIIVKPNGVDGARFPPIARPDRKPDEPFEVLSISRIEPKKGLTHLVEAVADLKKRGLRVKAHVVGSKDPHSKGSLEYAAEFERKIAELGVQDEVVLHGMMKQEDLPPLLQRCRAFVAPYVELGSGDKDGIPTAMLEGLASAMAVVTTDSGSILEVVSDGVEGLVVPQRDSKAFASALARLIEDPALERRLAKAARARFDREFDIRVTEKRLHERVAAAIAATKKAR